LLNMVRIISKAMWCVALALLPASALTISGVVKDSATGTPITTAMVSLRSWGSATAHVKIATDATGAYSLTWDTTGSIDLRARDTVGSYQTKDDTIAFSGTDAKTKDLLLVKVMKTSVSGTIGDIESSGSPIANAIVTLTPAAIGGVVFKDTTAADGKYKLDTVPATGKYTVSVTAPGYASGNDSVILNSTTAVVKDVQLKKIIYSKLNGSIEDAVTSGSAVPLAVISMMQFSGMTYITRSDTADSLGKYEFDSVATGKYTITVSKTGYVTYTDSITFADASPMIKNMSLKPLVFGKLKGFIGDNASSGTALANAVILISPTTPGGRSMRDTTGTDGAYFFDSVATGSYTLRVSAAGYVTKIDSALFTNSDTIKKDIQLNPIVYSSLKGAINDQVSSGTAIPNAIVILTPKTAGGVTKRDTTGTDGTYSFDSVMTGRYTISVTVSGFFSGTDSVTLSSSAQESKDVSLLPIMFVGISGVVKDSATDAVIKGAFILFIGSSPVNSQKKDTTDTDGKYSIDSGCTGRFIVNVTGYAPKTVTVSITSSSARTIDILLSKPSNPIKNFRMNNGMPGNPVAYMTERKSLRIANFSEPGTLRLYDISGRQVYSCSFNLPASQDIVLKNKVASGRYTVSVTQKKSVYRSRIIVP
jgi:large repetitive protein